MRKSGKRRFGGKDDSFKIGNAACGKTVEQNRVEYKEGWNPNDIIHTICAFANDLHNVNGGYLVIGIKAEDGIPVLPPQGIPTNRLDSIQQEIFQYCNMITPRYIPRIEVVDYKNSGTFLIYLWCSAGDSGPYQAPVVPWKIYWLHWKWLMKQIQN